MDGSAGLWGVRVRIAWRECSGVGNEKKERERGGRERERSIPQLELLRDQVLYLGNERPSIIQDDS